MSRRLQIILAIIIVAVIAGAIGAFFWSKGKSGNSNNNGNVKIGEAPSFRSDAPKNELINGFPKELILAKDAKLVESYSLDQEVKTSVAKFRTAMSIKDAYVAYDKYLNENQYSVEYKTEPDKGPVATIYAVKGPEIVNVTISASFGEQSTEINIGYTKK